jgi:1-aminocyclopropane-1-carboxylate deaminase
MPGLSSMIRFEAGHIQVLQNAAWQQCGAELHVLRLDRLHPQVSGNKWFKLQYYLEAALAAGKGTLLSFGGAYSNHIIATAVAAKLSGLHSIGIIRGEAPAKLSHTLLAAREAGMELREKDEELINSIIGQRNDVYRIPEGGYGPAGAKGAAMILAGVEKDLYTHICCATGTGTTLAGIINSLQPAQQAIGFPVLKGNHDLEDKVRALLADFTLEGSYHFGGYARHTPALTDFMNKWYLSFGIPSDFVYTGKLFFGIDDKIKKGQFTPGSRLLAIHTGGLQGNLSLPAGTLLF